MLKAIFALLPLVSILFMIFFLKKSSIFTGITTCIITILIAISPIFNTSIKVLPEPIVKSILTTSVIVYILFFGILLFQLMEKSGSIDGIATSIATSTNDKIYQILLLALGLSPLIEAVSGFGLAVIVIAPILIALGFSPVQSSLIALISLCIIPWGTLAMGTIIGSTLGNVPLNELGMGSALMCIPIYIYFAILTVYIGVGKKELLNRVHTVVFIGFLLGGSVWFCNRFVSVELAGLFGSLVVILFLFSLIKYQNKETIIKTKKTLASSFLKHVIPYLLLIILLFASRMVAPFKDFLSSTFTITMEKYSFQLELLYSPGFLLLIVCIFTILFYKMNKSEIKDSVNSTIKKCWPVIITTFLYVTVSEIMAEAKMIQLLSSLAAKSLEEYYIFFAPIIGAVGGFLTGSNTASNSMFIKLQTETALQASISPTLIACSQNVSSSLMTMVNPSRVALSCSISKSNLYENEVQKKIAFVGLGTITIILLELLIVFLNTSI